MKNYPDAANEIKAWITIVEAVPRSSIPGRVAESCGE
jgi:hypothetical protein